MPQILTPFKHDRAVTCCFTGHRTSGLPWGEDESDPGCMSVKKKLETAIYAAYEDGYRCFISGMATGIDTYAVETLLKLNLPGVEIEGAIPCPSQPDKWSYRQRERYFDLLNRIDSFYCISDRYTSSCMRERNKYMIDHSTRLIAVWNGDERCGTYMTINYGMNNQSCGIVTIPI